MGDRLHEDPRPGLVHQRALRNVRVRLWAQKRANLANSRQVTLVIDQRSSPNMISIHNTSN